MKLDAKKIGLAGGVIWGGSLFCLTWAAIWTGYAHDMLNVLTTMYPWYSISPVGSFTGALAGFLDAGIGSWLFAAIYNWLLER